MGSGVLTGATVASLALLGRIIGPLLQHFVLYVLFIAVCRGLGSSSGGGCNRCWAFRSASYN